MVTYYLKIHWPADCKKPCLLRKQNRHFSHSSSRKYTSFFSYWNKYSNCSVKMGIIKVVIIVAEGNEESEFSIAIDVFRRLPVCFFTFKDIR